MMTHDYQSWAAEYEAEARRLAATAVKYREKAKSAATVSQRDEYRDKARMYENLSREKLREAEIIRERK